MPQLAMVRMSLHGMEFNNCLEKETKLRTKQLKHWTANQGMKQREKAQ